MNEVRIIQISTRFKRKKYAKELKTFIESRKRQWNSIELPGPCSQVFSFAFDCNVSPIDGYKKAHFFKRFGLTQL